MKNIFTIKINDKKKDHEFNFKNKGEKKKEIQIKIHKKRWFIERILSIQW